MENQQQHRKLPKMSGARYYSGVSPADADASAQQRWLVRQALRTLVASDEAATAEALAHTSTPVMPAMQSAESSLLGWRSAGEPTLRAQPAPGTPLSFSPIARPTVAARASSPTDHGGPLRSKPVSPLSLLGTTFDAEA